MSTALEARLPQGLLEALRRSSACPALAYRAPPERLRGGNETLIYAFELADPPASLAGPLVVRLIHESYDPRRASWEAAVQGAVARAGFPAPRPRLAWTERSALGRAFLVMDRAAGLPLGAPTDPAALGGRRARLLFAVRAAARARRGLEGIASVLADELVRLHAVDPSPLLRELERDGVPARLWATEARIDELEARLDAARLDGLRPALARLRATPPPPPARPVICHGDFLPVNVLMQGGHVAAVIDWSFARIGDPAYDLGSLLAVLSVLPEAVPWPLRPLVRGTVETALAGLRTRYERGGALPDAAVRYWSALRKLWELSGIGARRRRVGETDRLLGGRDAWDHPRLVAALCAGVADATGAEVALPPRSGR